MASISRAQADPTASKRMESTVESDYPRQTEEEEEEERLDAWRAANKSDDWAKERMFLSPQQPPTAAAVGARPPQEKYPERSQSSSSRLHSAARGALLGPWQRTQRTAAIPTAGIARSWRTRVVLSRSSAANTLNRTQPPSGSARLPRCTIPVRLILRPSLLALSLTDPPGCGRQSIHTQPHSQQQPSLSSHPLAAPARACSHQESARPRPRQ